MSASEELLSYGYEETEPGAYTRSKAGKPRDKWVAVEGGFTRFMRDDGQWVGVPYKIAEKFEGVSGLLFETQPECFDTVYPEAEIENIYRVGNEERAKYDAERAAR